jgi:hypothetical protein
MKKLHILISLLFVTLFAVAQTSELEEFLKSQPQIVSVEKIEGNSFFTATYKIMVEQPVDYSDRSKGSFRQRVFVADKGKENPVLLITEGYGAGYAGNSWYLNELSPMLNSNQICVEHRYFGESWPVPLSWEYLTVANAAADHHKITELFKKYYSGKWINTGISKGGQTAVYHRSLYPDDVDFTVAYVCPLNFGVEDGRHEKFIKNVPGTAEQREKIKQFQLAVLKNRSEILPKLQAFSDEKNFTYKIPMDEVLDYCVLEYSFSIWQWGRSIDEIPDADAGADELFNHLLKVSGPAYFAKEGMENIKSFFIQAARELGYYGYDTKPFKKYLSIKSAKNYLSRIFLPDGVRIKYVKATSKKVKQFIKTTDSKILFIYGEFDPWSASAFKVPEKNNFLKIVKPGGSHSTRINNLPENQKEQVKFTLEEWLEHPVNIE